MGGRGSGRRSSPVSKRRVEAGLYLSISALAEHGLLVARTDACATVLKWLDHGNMVLASAHATVQLDETDVGDNGDDNDTNDTTERRRIIRLRYEVEVSGTVFAVYQDLTLRAETIANGGHRWWFACPSCVGRRGTLYLPPGEKYFACRRCHQLLYDSQARTRTG